MVEIFYVYMRQRLADVALKRRRIKLINIGIVSLDALSPLGDNKFKVQSKSNPSETYIVDISVGMCTCIKGENGTTCKHQTACAEYSMTVLPHLSKLNVQNRQWLAALAVGKDAGPGGSFFMFLGDPQHDSSLNINKEKSVNQWGQT